MQDYSGVHHHTKRGKSSARTCGGPKPSLKNKASQVLTRGKARALRRPGAPTRPSLPSCAWVPPPAKPRPGMRARTGTPERGPGRGAPKAQPPVPPPSTAASPAARAAVGLVAPPAVRRSARPRSPVPPCAAGFCGRRLLTGCVSVWLMPRRPQRCSAGYVCVWRHVHAHVHVHVDVGLCK